MCVFREDAHLFKGWQSPVAGNSCRFLQRSHRSCQCGLPLGIGSITAWCRITDFLLGQQHGFTMGLIHRNDIVVATELTCYVIPDFHITLIDIEGYFLIFAPFSGCQNTSQCNTLWCLIGTDYREMMIGRQCFCRK